MNAKELASILNGTGYGEISKKDEDLALKNGLVIVYGASDDLIELRGAIDDEADVYEGGVVKIESTGILRPPGECCLCDLHMCQYFKPVYDAAPGIKAIWGEHGMSWTYETDIPHEIFDIMEGEEVYCRGIIFSIEDVNQ